jgi:hypothetical protein
MFLNAKNMVSPRNEIRDVINKKLGTADPLFLMLSLYQKLSDEALFFYYRFNGKNWS